MALFSMPIQNVKWGRDYDPALDGPFIWEPTDDDRRWADRNHGQTLERLKARCGMSWCEMVAIVGHRPWDAADQYAAKAECERIIADRAALKSSALQPGGER
jgi:hypothetical protein